MSHYFETPDSPEERREVSATIWGRDYTFVSSNGVFSADRLDLGTSVLFRLSSPPKNRPGRFLDLGCGFGPIAIALARQCPLGIVDAVDTNERALGLTHANAHRFQVADRVNPLHPSQVAPEVRYDEIWSNPPIRIGKTALHELLTLWLSRLSPTGQARLVVGKNLGADSLHLWLESKGYQVDRVGSAKGFRVLTVAPNAELTQDQ
jgi:16S rRNA G1207 methylase RsmC